MFFSVDSECALPFVSSSFSCISLCPVLPDKREFFRPTIRLRRFSLSLTIRNASRRLLLEINCCDLNKFNLSVKVNLSKLPGSHSVCVFKQNQSEMLSWKVVMLRDWRRSYYKMCIHSNRVFVLQTVLASLEVCRGGKCFSPCLYAVPWHRFLCFCLICSSLHLLFPTDLLLIYSLGFTQLL